MDKRVTYLPSPISNKVLSKDEKRSQDKKPYWIYDYSLVHFHFLSKHTHGQKTVSSTMKTLLRGQFCFLEIFGNVSSLLNLQWLPFITGMHIVLALFFIFISFFTVSWIQDTFQLILTAVTSMHSDQWLHHAYRY